MWEADMNCAFSRYVIFSVGSRTLFLLLYFTFNFLEGIKHFLPAPKTSLSPKYTVFSFLLLVYLFILSVFYGTY
jgi:hypothetical protein